MLFWNVYGKIEGLTKSVVKDERGQDMIEYGLMVGIIAVGAVAAIGQIATKVQGYFTTLQAALP